MRSDELAGGLAYQEKGRGCQEREIITDTHPVAFGHFSGLMDVFS